VAASIIGNRWLAFHARCESCRDPGGPAGDAAGITSTRVRRGPLPRETARGHAELEGSSCGPAADIGYWRGFARAYGRARAAVAPVLGRSAPDGGSPRHDRRHERRDMGDRNWRAGDRWSRTFARARPARSGRLALRERRGWTGHRRRRTGPGPGAVLAGTGTGRSRRIPGSSPFSHVSGPPAPASRSPRSSPWRTSRGARWSRSTGRRPSEPSSSEVRPDFYAVPRLRKWLLGPEGTGGLYCARPCWSRTSGVTFAELSSFDVPSIRPPRAALDRTRRRFEIAASPALGSRLRPEHAWPVDVRRAAWIYERTARLAGRRGGRCWRNPWRRGGHAGRPTIGRLVTFASPAGSRARPCRAVTANPRHRPNDPPSRRSAFSVGFFNTDGELPPLRDGVALVAAHTPETDAAPPQIEVLRGGPRVGGLRPVPFGPRRPPGRARAAARTTPWTPRSAGVRFGPGGE